MEVRTEDNTEMATREVTALEEVAIREEAATRGEAQEMGIPEVSMGMVEKHSCSKSWVVGDRVKLSRLCLELSIRFIFACPLG